MPASKKMCCLDTCTRPGSPPFTAWHAAWVQGTLCSDTLRATLHIGLQPSHSASALVQQPHSLQHLSGQGPLCTVHFISHCCYAPLLPQTCLWLGQHERLPPTSKCTSGCPSSEGHTATTAVTHVSPTSSCTASTAHGSSLLIHTCMQRQQNARSGDRESTRK